MKDEICRKFAIKLKEIREAKNVSQGKLSVEAECAKSYIGMIENGKKMPTLKIIAKLARALKVHVKDLFDFEYNYKDENWED